MTVRLDGGTAIATAAADDAGDQPVLRRSAMAVAVGVFAAALSLRYRMLNANALPSDFALLWRAARVWRDGFDPYQVIGAGRTFLSDFPLVYPLPAVIVALPFSFLSLPWADALFAGLSAGLFTAAVTRRRLADPRLLALVSLATLYVIQTTQWSMLLAASALLPMLGPLWVCKPTIGAALLLASRRKSAALGGAAFVIGSIVVKPTWVSEWLALLPATPHVAPLIRQTVFGPLVLLALLRWRRADARLLAALVCVPQTSLLYETIPLFLIATGWTEAIALSVLSFVAWEWWLWLAPFPSYADAIAASGRTIVWCMYLPATVAVVLRRNEWTELDV